MPMDWILSATGECVGHSTGATRASLGKQKHETFSGQAAEAGGRAGWRTPYLVEFVLQVLRLLLCLLLLLLEASQQLHLLLVPVLLADLQLLGEVHDSTVGLSQEMLVLLTLPLQCHLPVRQRTLRDPFACL